MKKLDWNPITCYGGKKMFFKLSTKLFLAIMELKSAGENYTENHKNAIMIVMMMMMMSKILLIIIEQKKKLDG